MMGGVVRAAHTLITMKKVSGLEEEEEEITCNDR